MSFYEIIPDQESLMPNRYYKDGEYFYHSFMFRLRRIDDKCIMYKCPFCFYNQRIIKKIIKFQRRWRRFYKRHCNVKSIMRRQIYGRF